MATPPLMSERDDPTGKWRDCTYASHLMGAWKTGYRAYPLGYTWQEREALEKADDRPDNTGANVGDLEVAMQRRYGFTLAQVTATLDSVLRGPSTTGFAVAGSMSQVPSNLRRWQPDFTGNHSVYVEPMGDKMHVRWLDPLATWGFLGDIVPVETVTAFNKGFGITNVRSAREGTQTGYRLTVSRYAGTKKWYVDAGQTINGYDPNYPGKPRLTKTFAAASSASADAEVTVTWPGYSNPPVPRGGPFLRVVDGAFKGLLIVKSQVVVR